MHTRFALLALVLGLLILVRLVRTGNAARGPAFLAVPILSGIGWVAAAYAMYGTLNPAAAYGGQTDTSFAFLPNGLGGLLFDQGFGLIATAPALVIAFAELLRTRRFAADWGLTALVYALAVGSYAMWWAGTSGPARFLVPLLLPLALPAAAAWQAARSRAVRVLMLLTLGVTACLSAVLAGGSGGFLAYHSRNVYGMTPAPWLGWANPLVDLSQALPAFVPLPLGTPVGARMAAARDGFASTVPWILCMTVAVYVTLRVGRTRARLHELVVAAVAALALAAMAASSIVWWMHGGQRGDPLDAQLNVLRRLSNGRALTLDLQNARRVSGVEALRLRLDIATDNAVVPLLPAGSYVVSTRGVLHTPLAIYAGADEEPFAIATVDSGDLTSGVPLDLPVMVRALTFRAATFAGASAIEVRPIAPRLGAGSAYLSGVAHHAAAYGNTDVFFLDDRTAPEADGFWIWGSREGRVVFSSTSARPIVTLRNGAVRNDVTIRVGNDPEQQVALEPGQERQVSLPALYVDAAYLLTIRTSAGFRPSDVDPHSQDRRFLGVYVVMPDHAVR